MCIYLFTALSRDGNHAVVPLKLWQKLYMLMLLPFAIHQVKTYIYNYIYIYPNQSEAADLRIMVHGSNEPRSNAHWPNCIGSILRVAKRVMQFSDATYLSIHSFICVSTYPVIYVYYVISSFLSYIYIYIYMYYIDTHNMPNVKVEPAGSQPVRHRPTA